MKLYYNQKLKVLASDLRNNPTQAEKSLWYALKSKQVMGFDFHRQKPIGNYIFDFFCFNLKLVIEVDGFSHDFKEVKEKDKAKDEFIKSIGFNILRFTDEEILGNPNEVVSRIEEYIIKFKSHTPLSPLDIGEKTGFPSIKMGDKTGVPPSINWGDKKGVPPLLRGG